MSSVKQEEVHGQVQQNEASDDGEEGPLNIQESQSVIARRLLRSHYRQLRSNISHGKDDLGRVDSNMFEQVFEMVEDLHNLVEKPREQIADAEAFLDITNTLLDVAKNAVRKYGMSAAEFVGAILQQFGTATVGSDQNQLEVNWKRLGLEVCGIFCEAPGVSTMIGPMDIVPKQRRVPNWTRGRDKPTSITKPEELGGNEEMQTETDANMETMYNILRRYKQVALDCLVLNRISFAQTVENLFCLSFLVKDGNAEITFSEDGKSLVVPRNAPNATDRTSGKVQNTQFVFRFDFNDWKLMQSSVEDGEELMPHRKPSGLVSKGASSSKAPTPIRKNSRNRARETPLVSSPSEDDVEDRSQLEVDARNPKKARLKSNSEMWSD